MSGKTMSIKVMQALTEKLMDAYGDSNKASVAIQIETRSWDETQFGLYAPGISVYNWKYFKTWDELYAFAKNLIAEKRREQNEENSVDR